MGLLLHQPGTPEPDGGDRFVLALQVDGDAVVFHDPHGFPYGTLPVADFLTAWQAKGIGYIDAPYVLRTGFVREREVASEQALRDALPGALRWLAGRADLPVPPGTLGGARAVHALAAQTDKGLDAGVRAWSAASSIHWSPATTGPWPTHCANLPQPTSSCEKRSRQKAANETTPAQVLRRVRRPDPVRQGWRQYAR